MYNNWYNCGYMVKSGAVSETTPGKNKPGNVKINGLVFIVAVLDMSWRLAIAVLVPIIGGFELDKHFDTTPALTIVGFLLAMAGLFFILKRTLAVANDKFKSTGGHR